MEDINGMTDYGEEVYNRLTIDVVTECDNADECCEGD